MHDAAMMMLSTDDWQGEANCFGIEPDLFFPESGADVVAAKSVCAGCTVRGACLEHAMREGELFGVWGGLDEAERRQLRRRRQLEVRA